MYRSYQPSFLQNQHEKIEAVNPSAANYRFNTFDESAQKYLREQGFIVIKNILDEKEIIYAKSLLWNYLSNLGWKRNNPATWNTHVINAKGIIWTGAGQSKLQWFLRSRPRIIKTFANVWSAQDIYSKENIKFDYKRDMLTSMDGFSVFRPWYLKNISQASTWKTESGWYHIDQNIARCPDIETIQGIVSLYDQDKSTGSTVFVPGSHKWVKNLLPNLSIYKGDFVMIPRKKLDAMHKKKILLCCRAGDLILWDARCIHCNSPAILSQHEMRVVHTAKLLSRSTQHLYQEEKKEEKMNININKTERDFIQSMNKNYLKAKISKNLNGMKNKIEYNGYIVDVILWENFDEKLFSTNKAYLFCLPWNTSILWIPKWMDKITGNNLKKLIIKKIKFKQPTLRFDVQNKNGEIIRIKQVKQNRNTAWICNNFNQSVQNRKDTDILPAIKLEEWSNCLLKHASDTASNKFNAMLMIQYLNGNNNINLHSDNDYGLGINPMIGSLSLGQKRTFFIKSKQIYHKSGQKIEIRIPLIHGSFILMDALFQNFWLHSIPKEKEILGERINITFRKYALEKDEIKVKNEEVKAEVLDVDNINVPSILRGVTYICMTPKLKVKSKDIIRQRIAAYETLCTCSHWPHKCHVLYKPKNVKQGLNINDVKDELIKSLIGVDMLTDPKYDHINDNVPLNDDKYKWKKNKFKKNKKSKWLRKD